MQYATSICVNISARFPENSCKVLEAFSIFNVDVLPASPSSPSFRVHGEDEIAILAKQFSQETMMNKKELLLKLFNLSGRLNIL